MSKLERNVNRVYTLGGLVLLTVVIMAMSSCGTSYYHVGTGYPAKNTCSGSPSSHPQY
jgi:hypothetical protein